MPVVSGTQYAQTADLANLGLIGGVLASISTATQNAALLARSGYCDSKLQGRYILPLTQWGQDLVLAVCKMAAWDLLASKGYNPAAGADTNVEKRARDAEQWLQDIADEKTSLAYAIDSSVGGVPTNVTPPSDGSLVFATSGAFQGQTTQTRGWTDRGLSSPPTESQGTGWDP